MFAISYSRDLIQNYMIAELSNKYLPMGKNEESTVSLIDV